MSCILDDINVKQLNAVSGSMGNNILLLRF